MIFNKKSFTLTVIVICVLTGLLMFNYKSDGEEKKDTHMHKMGDKSLLDINTKLKSLIPLVAAKVNGVEITRKRLQMAVKAVIERYKMMGRAVPPNMAGELVKSVANQIVEEELLFQEKTKLNIIVNDEDIKKEIDQLKARFSSEDLFKEMLKQQNIDLKTIKEDIARNKTVMKVIKIEIEDKLSVDMDEIKAYYKSNIDKMKEPASIKVSHILIKVNDKTDLKENEKAKGKISDVLKMAKKGEDFGELAKKHSEGPSASKGGDLGYFSKGKMVPSFEATAFSLNVGEISEIVETPFGFHIIKMFDKKEGKLMQLEEMKEKIKSFLMTTKGREKLSNWLKKLRKEAKIEMFL